MIQNDQNAKGIVKALRDAGATCEYWIPYARQKGLPDIVVGHRGRTYLMEIKQRGKKASESQEAFYATWKGGPIVVVRTETEALAAIGIGAIVAGCFCLGVCSCGLNR